MCLLKLSIYRYLKSFSHTIKNRTASFLCFQFFALPIFLMIYFFAFFLLTRLEVLVTSRTGLLFTHKGYFRQGYRLSLNTQIEHIQKTHNICTRQTTYTLFYSNKYTQQLQLQFKIQLLHNLHFERIMYNILDRLHTQEYLLTKLTFYFNNFKQLCTLIHRSCWVCLQVFIYFKCSHRWHELQLTEGSLSVVLSIFWSHFWHRSS